MTAPSAARIAASTSGISSVIVPVRTISRPWGSGAAIATRPLSVATGRAVGCEAVPPVVRELPPDSGVSIAAPTVDRIVETWPPMTRLPATTAPPIRSAATTRMVRRSVDVSIAGRYVAPGWERER